MEAVYVVDDKYQKGATSPHPHGLICEFLKRCDLERWLGRNPSIGGAGGPGGAALRTFVSNWATMVATGKGSPKLLIIDWDLDAKMIEPQTVEGRMVDDGESLIDAISAKCATWPIALVAYSNRQDAPDTLSTNATIPTLLRGKTLSDAASGQTKPLKHAEAIVRGALEKAFGGTGSSDIRHGKMEFDKTTRSIRFSPHGKGITLSPVAAKLLERLWDARGIPIRKADLERQLKIAKSKPKSRPIDTHLQALRDADPFLGEHIITIGRGEIMFGHSFAKQRCAIPLR